MIDAKSEVFVTEEVTKTKHAGGRPRTVSPPPEECIELGKEMVEWVIRNKPTHLSEWFSIEKMIAWKTWNAMCELPEFLPYYERALSLVAQNCRNGTLNPSLAQRFLSLYHRDLKKEERDEKAYEAELKRQQTNDNHSGDVGKLADAIDRLASKREANPSDSDKQ